VGKINSKRKGKVAELAFAHFMCDTFGFKCRRGMQYSGTPESPDVVGLDGIHIEVKHREHLNLHEAMEQAKRECGGNIPLVAHRKNHTEWLLTIRAKDLTKFLLAIVSNLASLPSLFSVPLVSDEYGEAFLQGDAKPD